MRLTLPHGGVPHARLVLLAQTRRGYGNLSHWITLARRRAVKGAYLAHPGDIEGKEPTAPMLAGLPDCLALWVPHAGLTFEDAFAQAMWVKTWFQERAAIALELLHRSGDDDLLDLVHRVARFTGLPVVAAGDVLMHVRSPQAAAGHADRDAPRAAGRRLRPRARAERRGAPAFAPAPRRALRTGVARADAGASPAPAASRSTSCATSTRRRSCRPARRRPAT
jgi:hypothetical protein